MTTREEIQRFVDQVFPQARNVGIIESLEPMGARVRRVITEAEARPGGTVSGPTLMALADYAMWVALLHEIGPVALAVTTHFSIDFLRKPALKDVIAEVKLLKLGKRLAVGDIYLFSDGEPDLIARASATYSIPTAEPARGAAV
jgi:acyl-coenzyme A thioesterase PaaI-like protein